MATEKEDYTYLLNEIVALEARISALETSQVKLRKSLIEWMDIQSRFRWLADLEVADIFSRLKSVELKLFPKIASDIIRVANILGDREETPFNRLDVRSASNSAPRQSGTTRGGSGGA